MFLLSGCVRRDDGFVYSGADGAEPVIVWQPSHQRDTSEKINEALVCNGIAEAAMAAAPHYREYKVWSFNRKGLHDGSRGTNTALADTSAVVDGKKSGYAWELEKANSVKPLVFIAMHNNNGAGANAVWGYIHDGDAMESANRELAKLITARISAATGLADRGVLHDSSTGRNDYRCAATGRLAFYSIDENVNSAPYRVLLEIGDGDLAPEFLGDPANQRKIGEAIKRGLAEFLRSARR
ncbi:MAG: hypothetical protein WC421_02260 [Elusimicrobiales bacterium]